MPGMPCSISVTSISIKIMLKRLYLISVVGFILNFGPQIRAQNAAISLLADEFIEHPVLEDATVAVHIGKLENNESVVDKNANKALVPASTLKILYSLMLLDKFGKDYKLETNFYYSGDILEDGSLEGDLIIKASGDPSFLSGRDGRPGAIQDFFGAVLKRLKKKGIRCIDGDLILLLPYTSYPVCSSWPWEDLGNYYGGGAWGFNFLENSLDVFLDSPAKQGAKCIVEKVEPVIPFLKMGSDVISAHPKSGDQAYVYGDPYTFYRLIQGNIPSGKSSFRIKASIPNPPVNFAQMFSSYLESNGIYINDYKIKESYERDLRSLGKYKSQALLSIVKNCMDYSINLYSEAFGHLLLQANDLNTEAYPSETIWEKLCAKHGIDDSKVKIVDACGLSPENLIPAREMTAFIGNMENKLGIKLLLETFSGPGSGGSGVSFFKRIKHKNRLWIKSGSIANVHNYAGIYKSLKSNEYYSFCIFTNHNLNTGKKTKELIQSFLNDLIELTE